MCLFYSILTRIMYLNMRIRSKDPRNLKVKSRISEEILLAKENLYSKLLIESKHVKLSVGMFEILWIGAIQRYFESRRRNWREATTGDKEKVTVQAKKRRCRSRKDRVCQILIIIMEYFIFHFYSYLSVAAKLCMLEKKQFVGSS